MLPQPQVVYVVVMILFALIGVVLGMLAGWLCTLATRLPLRLRVDAALGACGFLGGDLVAAVMPWHRNTITYRLGATQVESTMNTYQHPERVAVLFAVLLPISFQCYRLLRSRSSSRSR